MVEGSEKMATNLMEMVAQATGALPQREEDKKPKTIVGTEGVQGWAGNEGNYWPARYCDRLPPGLYYPEYNQGVSFFKRTNVEADEILMLPDYAGSKIIEEFKRFWGLREEFEKRGFIHKRGFLLHGPPGSGKTALLRLMSRELIEAHNGIVVFVGHPRVAVEAFRTLRRVEKERPIVALLEDFDALAVGTGHESEYLAMLDGELQVNNIIFLATTNYPERLDKRFTARPGRFDTVVKIDHPSDAARRFYFQQKERLVGEELELWVKLSHGLSVAHMREMILANRCMGQPIEEVAQRLHYGLERPPVSEDPGPKKKLGFKD